MEEHGELKIHCRRVLERAYLFLDGEVLTDAERAEIEGHLRDCGPCYERFGLEQEVTSLVAKLRGCDECPDDVRTRITGLLEGL